MDWTSYSTPLLEGAWVTIQLTIFSTVLGAVFAFAFGVGKISRNWLAKGVSIFFIEVFRGTSLLVQLFWLYFRSEEHTSELQSLMRISYAVFCLKKKKKPITIYTT